MHPRLTGILRTIAPAMPADIRTRDAWAIIKPDGPTFVRGSFWHVLQNTLPFAHTPERQLKVANWMFRIKEREEKARRAWPPKPIAIKPALVPQPHTT